jgi:hypothetical protein
MCEPDDGDILVLNKHIYWDPIGPWVRQGIAEDRLDKERTDKLTATQIELQKEAIDAIAESVSPG